MLLLVIFSGFWGMMDVLFGFMPLFLDSFSNLPGIEADIDRAVPLTRWVGHWLNPEVFVSLDALLIVLFQALVSYFTRSWHPLTAILIGTSVCTLAWVMPALSPVAGVVASGILVWSFGEMVCSARFFEYCGTVAPRNQVGVYLAYSFFSIFLGNLYSGPWAGFLHQRHVTDRVAAGLAPHSAHFFGGVMLLGALSAVGLVLYALFVVPPHTQREPAA